MDTTYAWCNVTTSIVMNVVLSNKRKDKFGYYSIRSHDFFFYFFFIFPPSQDDCELDRIGFSSALSSTNGGKFEIKRQDKRHFGNLCLLRN